MSMPSPEIVIIATGSEITNGKSTDTNSGWIANELSGYGFKILQIVALPDDPHLILTTLEYFSKSKGSRWLIMTGGLGPTSDDYTVDVVLKLTGKKAIQIESAKLKLETSYKSRGSKYEKILEHAMRQTRVPEKSIVMENNVGIAPGFIVELNTKVKLACLPGVPPEMMEMFKKFLLPRLLEEFGKNTKNRLEYFVWNIGESLFQKQFIEKNPDINETVEWGVAAKRGYIKVAFLSEDKNLLEKISQDLNHQYREQISGDIFEGLHTILTERKERCVVAESCTGGWMSKIITDRPGSSAYFIAALVTYHNQSKQDFLFVPSEILSEKGAVSEETCIAMLNGLEKQFDSDYFVSITGIAGPEGGSKEKPVGTVYIGTKRKNTDPRIVKYFFPGSREVVREAAANTAIFQLFKEVTLRW